jgi:hypothetical protein
LTTEKATAAGAYGQIDSFKRLPGGKIKIIPGGGRGAIVKVRVPVSMLKKFINNDDVEESSEAYGEYQVRSPRLGREFIHSVEIYDGGKKSILRP